MGVNTSNAKTTANAKSSQKFLMVLAFPTFPFFNEQYSLNIIHYNGPLRNVKVKAIVLLTEMNRIQLSRTTEIIKKEDMAKTNLTQRDKSKLETRQRLMAAGLELFTQRGYTNTRAADIAARAGVAVGTLYLHFGDKEGLLHALAEATINRLYDHVEKLYLREIDSSEELARTHIAALVDFVEENRPAVRFLLGAEVSDLPGISQALELAIGQVEGMLRRGQTAGLYRPDINPRLAARAEAGMNLGLLSWWSAHPGEATRNEIIDTLAKMRMSGLHAAPTKQE